MRLTIVGCSGSFPGPQSPSSCYLVEADGYRVLLDLGNGALGYLARHIDIKDVDAVLLSHLHADHFMDLTSMYVARSYHPAGPLPKVAVHGPRGVSLRLSEAYGHESQDKLREVFDFVEWQLGTTYDVGPLQVSVARVAHPVLTYAMRVQHDDAVLAYSGDTGPCDSLVDIARGAHLFLCEASFQDTGQDNAPDLHLTGLQAGEHATRAVVRHLVVTHVPPWYDPADAVAEARRTFAGQIDMARSGDRYELPAHP